MVPIATALAFIAMLLFIFGSYKLTSWADYVSKPISGLVRYADEQATTGTSFIAAILAWASFGIAYTLTPKVERMLQRYNTEGSGNGFTLDTIRGNTTWILLAGAVRPIFHFSIHC